MQLLAVLVTASAAAAVDAEMHCEFPCAKSISLFSLGGTTFGTRDRER